MLQPDLIDIFILPLIKGKVDYFITGSVASTLYGEPRLTHDIDLVLILPQSHIAKFISLFNESDYYCPPKEIIQIELSRSTFAHFNLIHHDTGYKADIYPFTGDELHSWAIKNRRKICLKSNVDIWVAPPEYVIIKKLYYYQEGGSQKHLSDIKKIIDSHDVKVDMTIIEEWSKSRNLIKEWIKAQSFC